MYPAKLKWMFVNKLVFGSVLINAVTNKPLTLLLHDALRLCDCLAQLEHKETSFEVKQSVLRSVIQFNGSLWGGDC